MSSRNICVRVIIIVLFVLLLGACGGTKDDNLNNGVEIIPPDKIVTGEVINKESGIGFFEPWFHLEIEDEIQGRYPYRTTSNLYDMVAVGDSLTITYKWMSMTGEYYVMDMTIK